MTRVARLCCCLSLMIVALAACDQRPPEATETVPGAAAEAGAEAGAPAVGAMPPQPVSAPAVESVVVASDSVVVGSAVGPDGAASAPKPFYGLDDTIHASARANGEAKVYWTYQDGSSHKEEVKPANGIVTFDFDRSQGMRPGNYTVEIDIDGVPVGITDFVVK